MAAPVLEEMTKRQNFLRATKGWTVESHDIQCREGTWHIEAILIVVLLFFPHTRS